MKKKKHLLYIFVILLFLVIIIIPKKTSFSDVKFDRKSNPRDIIEDKTLRVAVDYLQKPLNPFFDGGNSISLISKFINASLVVKGKNNEVSNQLAKNIWYEDDGKTIAVILRDDIKFQSGKKITSKDVYNTFSVLANRDYGGKYSYFVDGLRGYYRYKTGLIDEFIGVEIIEDQFLKFHFNRFNFTNINTLTFPILNISDKDLESGIIHISNMEFTDGAGNYKVESFENNQIKLSIKDSMVKTNIANIIIKNLKYNDALREFSSGSVDIIYKYHKNENFEKLYIDRLREFSYSIDTEGELFNYIGFNPESIYFNDKELRRGLRDSINIEKIIEESVMKGLYSFSKAGIHSNSWFELKEFNFTKGENLRQILEKKFVFQGPYFVDANNNPISIKIGVMKNNQFYNTISKELVSQIEQQGIKVDVDYYESDQMFEALRGNRYYDIIIAQKEMSVVPDTESEKFNLDERNTLTRDLENSYQYLQKKISEDGVDENITNLIIEWYEFFDETTPYIVLGNEVITTVINNNIKGIYINEFVDIDNIENIEQIYID